MVVASKFLWCGSGCDVVVAESSVCGVVVVVVARYWDRGGCGCGSGGEVFLM